MKAVSAAALARVFGRSLFLQAAWNPRGMQNLGFAYAMEPALAALYPDGPARAAAAARHLEFFNCHPYLAAAILGGSVRLEERVAAGEATPEQASLFKRTLGPPLAAVGDGFFWLALRPAAALAAAATAPFLGLWCVLVFLGLYNSAHLGLRTWLFVQGYQRGEGVVEVIARAHLSTGTPLLKAVGAALAGVLSARVALGAALGGHPARALWVGAFIALAVLALPRLGLLRALYLSVAIGLALGASIL